MKAFTDSFGFVVFFLVGTLMFDMIFGDKVVFWYLLLILIGMIFANKDQFTALLGRYSTA